MLVKNVFCCLINSSSPTNRLPSIAILVFLTLFVAGFGYQQAYAQQEDTGVLNVGKITTTTGTTTTAKTVKSTAGKYDRFIGLDKTTYVFAMAKKKVVVREKKSVNSKCLGTFSKKNCIIVDTSKMRKGIDYVWLTVKLKNKARGYVLAKDVKLLKVDTTTFGLDPTKKADKKRIKACKKGFPYIGVDYNHSGPTMKTGMMCTKFVLQCLKDGGYKLTKGKWSLSGIPKLGKRIKREQLRPGDVVMYRTSGSGSPTHAALYIGKGLIINSSGAQGWHYPAGGIRVSHLDYRTPAPYIFLRFLK